MKVKIIPQVFLALIFAATLLALTAGQTLAQGQSDGQDKAKSKKELKATNKEANKLAAKADEVGEGLGRDVVFCILAAHTTDVGTAQQLKDKFASLQDFPFGQFVAAVIMADRIDKPLDDILTKLQAGQSIGQIAKEFDVNMGELRQGFGQFRSELARSMTNPPTKDCFKTS
jgi:hypothetical protein